LQPLLSHLSRMALGFFLPKQHQLYDLQYAPVAVTIGSDSACLACCTHDAAAHHDARPDIFCMPRVIPPPDRTNTCDHCNTKEWVAAPGDVTPDLYFGNEPFIVGEQQTNGKWRVAGGASGKHAGVVGRHETWTVCTTDDYGWCNNDDWHLWMSTCLVLLGPDREEV
jgi:hypothetical protein